jgi:ABC-type multidrug transport system fused ATPase/permease subunit
MDQGQLVERGSHDGLMAQAGIYAKLVRLQFEGEDAARA